MELNDEINKDINECKNISISGTSTRYQMKKLIETKKKNVKRKEYALLKKKNCSYDEQLDIIYNITNNIKNEITGQAINEIKHKLSSYKQQDILKEVYNKELFINFNSLIQMLNECKLKCHYCLLDIYIIYELVRDGKQWTLDRIDNNKGHNEGNILISCLECNLKRRITNKDAFMFTKNLKIIRSEYSI
jgi:RecG-like helicase